MEGIYASEEESVGDSMRKSDSLGEGKRGQVRERGT